MERYEYQVVHVSQGVMGGRVSEAKLARALNRAAADGWRLKDVTVAHSGSGGSTDGLLLTFERPTA